MGLGRLTTAPIRGAAWAAAASGDSAVGGAVDMIGRGFMRRVGWILAGALIFGAAQLLGIELPR